MADVITAAGDKSPPFEYVFDCRGTMGTATQLSTRQRNHGNHHTTVTAGCATGLLLFWQQLLFRSVMPAAPELSATILGNERTDVGWLVFIATLMATSTICCIRNLLRARTIQLHCAEGAAEQAQPAWQPLLALACICMCAGSLVTLFFPAHATCILAGGALAGVGFAFGATSLIDALWHIFPGDIIAPALLVAAACQLIGALFAGLIPKTAVLVALCMLPMAFALCVGKLMAHLPESWEKADRQANVVNALAKRKAQHAFIVCLVTFFFAILYTNITGFKFNSFHSDELLDFNLEIMIVKCLIFAASVALTHKHLTAACPLVITALFGASMLIVVFAPTAPGALLLADSFAAAGRLFAFVYAYLVAGLMQVARWPQLMKPAQLVLCSSSFVVMLSVVSGSVVQNLIARDATSFALATAAILYVLLIVSNIVMRTSQEGSLTVRLEGERVDEERIATCRAQAVAAQHPQLTERETEILKCVLLGLTAPTIAERLSISENTAKTHMRRIYRKLEVHSRQELLELAYSTVPPTGMTSSE